MNIKKANFIILLLLLFPNVFAISNNNEITTLTNQKRNISQKINSREKNTEEYKNKIIKLNEIRNILISKNEQLKVIRSQIKQSKNILKSKQSSWYPNLEINSNEFPKYTTGDIKNKLNEDSASNQLKTGLNANIEWDIINPSRKLEIRIAEEKLENLNLLYESTLRNLFLEAINIYYAVRASNQEIKVAEQAIKISLISLKESENKLIAGIGNKLDVLEAKAQLNRNKINLLNRQNKLNRNLNSLGEILNIDEQISIDNNEQIKISKIWDKSLKESLDNAFNKNLEIKIKEKNININSNEALSVLSKKKPTFTLYNVYSISSASGETGVTSPNYNNLIKSNSNNLGIKFNWNIFDGGNIKQNYLSLNNKNKELKSELNLEKNQLKKDIKNALNEYKISKEKIIFSKLQLEASKEALNISLKRLEAGITTQREIVNKQGDLIEAETNFINSIKEYQINLAKLSRLTLMNDHLICEKRKKIHNKKNIEFIEFLTDNNLNMVCSN